MTKNKINYSLLKKASDSKGVLYETVNGVNYIGIPAAVIYGMDDKEFEEAIGKTKATEYVGLAEAVHRIIPPMEDQYAVAYTKVCYNSNSLFHFFITEKGEVIKIDGRLLGIIKDADIDAIFGRGMKNPLIFNVGNKKAIILPVNYANCSSNEVKLIKSIQSMSFGL